MKNTKRKIQRLTPEQLDANYNKYMKDESTVENGKKIFEKTLKKAVKK
jgi:hypothetical protein